jgi:dihydropteroate synthase
LPAQLVEADRTLVMGVLNVTPDSFSDGGRYLAPADAIAHGEALHAAGADLVDVGGESTRPGAQRVAAEEEAARVLPVIRALAAAGVPVSIDTSRSTVAAAAVEAGACAVNDVSGGLADPRMHQVVAALSVPYIAMHWRGPSGAMMLQAEYDDVVGEVVGELRDQMEAALDAGIAADRIVLDPGLGFAKEPEHNWALLARLPAIAALGRPLLIGPSRKRFLGELLAEGGQPRPLDERDAATDAICTLAAAQGVWCVRVHDVRGCADAVQVVARLQQEQTRA